MKTHAALAIANWFLARGEAENTPLSPMKLQKLIYFAYGWCLAITGIPLIEEHPEAWDYGPVIAPVYHKFKKFGSRPITSRATEIAPNERSAIEPTVGDDTDAERLLLRIWEVYGGLTAIQLSNMTHDTEGAWYKTYHDLAKGRRGADIPDDLIKEEFTAKAERGAAQPEAAA